MYKCSIRSQYFSYLPTTQVDEIILGGTQFSIIFEQVSPCCVTVPEGVIIWKSAFLVHQYMKWRLSAHLGGQGTPQKRGWSLASEQSHLIFMGQLNGPCHLLQRQKSRSLTLWPKTKDESSKDLLLLAALCIAALLVQTKVNIQGDTFKQFQFMPIHEMGYNFNIKRLSKDINIIRIFPFLKAMCHHSERTSAKKRSQFLSYKCLH